MWGLLMLVPVAETASWVGGCGKKLEMNQLFLRLRAAAGWKVAAGAMLTEQPLTGGSKSLSPFLPPILPVPAEVSRKPGDTEEISLQNPSCIITRQNREGALGAQIPGACKSYQMPLASAGGVEAGAKWSPGKEGSKSVLTPGPLKRMARADGAFWGGWSPLPLLSGVCNGGRAVTSQCTRRQLLLHSQVVGSDPYQVMENIWQMITKKSLSSFCFLLTKHFIV